MKKEIPYKQITEKEYNIAVENSEWKINVMAIKLSNPEETKYLYIETEKIEISEKIMLKTYLNDLYNSAWDKVEITDYRKD